MIHIEYHSLVNAPPVLIPEFEHIRRFSVRDSKRLLARIGPGEYFATENGELIATTLGSCVSACIRNTETGVGGMNHFLLPDFWEGGGQDRWESTLVSAPARYGNVAMERLINVVLGDHSQRGALEVKVFGAAKVLRANIDIGERNASFVKSYLRTEGLKITAQDLGGTAPRKIIYDPKTGDVFVRKLGRGVKDRVVREELHFIETIHDHPETGSVELFSEGGNS